MNTRTAAVPPPNAEPSAPISAAVPRRTIQAIRPEEIERVTIGEPGLVLGDKYRLVAPLAAGGMASVWTATHMTLDRPVAVKFVDARIVTDHVERLDRFLREAKVAASVRHKNVVDILDFGLHGEGEAAEPFMVMELLEGEALDARLTRGPLTTEQIVSVVSQVLSGLDAVHAAGIVHRDVKPANVFVTEDADGLFVRVIDFGVSQGAGDAHDGTVIGTPEYMSPEQAFGDPLDLRSDLYSVGVLLYELLAGFVPFDAPDPRQVLALVVAGKPLGLGAMRADVPALCAVVEKAMARRAIDRFASAREMQRALLAAHEASVVPGVDESGRRARESLATVDGELLAVPRPEQGRSNASVGVAALALVVGIVGAGVWYWLGGDGPLVAQPRPPVVTFVAATTADEVPVQVPVTEVVAATVAVAAPPITETPAIPAPAIPLPAPEAIEVPAPEPPAASPRPRPAQHRSSRSATPETSGAAAIQRELDF